MQAKQLKHFTYNFIVLFSFFPCLVHDQSTFRSGDVRPERWFFQENTSFFLKGRDRSHTVSHFLVQRPSGPFFELSENEWKQAIAKYKSLSIDGDVNYIDRTAKTSINIGTDAYFDNDTILVQFEFQTVASKAIPNART